MSVVPESSESKRAQERDRISKNSRFGSLSKFNSGYKSGAADVDRDGLKPLAKGRDRMRRAAILCGLCFLTMAAAAWAGTTVIRRTATTSRVTKRIQVPTQYEMLFGDRSIAPTVVRSAAGSIDAFRFLNKTAGTARSITIYVSAHNTASSLLVGLYGDLNGRPGARLATASLSSPRAGGWNTVTIRSADAEAGHNYWIAVLAKRGSLFFRDRRAGSCSGARSQARDLSAMPASWQKVRPLSTCAVSAYVSGTITGGIAKTAGGDDPPETSTTAAAPTGTTASVTPPTGEVPVDAVTVPTLPPVNTGAPAVSGTAQEGETLSATRVPGHSPSSYGYQWQHCSGLRVARFPVATASTYMFQSSDVGDTIDVVVTATNTGGSRPATRRRLSVQRRRRR